MRLRTLGTIDAKNKTILYRSPYDIGVTKSTTGEWEIKDNSRITATIPTLNYLLDQSCKIVILTYVNRPEGKVVEELRTTPHAKELSRLLDREVKKADDCVGPEVEKAISELKPSELLMLENTRFHPEEDLNDDNFARELCVGKDLIVFDGFPQAHRSVASTTGILRHLPSVAGFYFEKEIEELSKLVIHPQKPFVIIIGGAKVEDKLEAAKDFVEIADKMLIGGKVAKLAVQMKKTYPAVIVLPEDYLDGDLDIGPKTQRMFSDYILNAKTVFWAGPMGVYEKSEFSDGTRMVAEAMSRTSAETIIAGGDTIDAVKKFGDISKMTHVSLAGGAALKFLAGKKLPVVEMLKYFD